MEMEKIFRSFANPIGRGNAFAVLAALLAMAVAPVASAEEASGDEAEEIEEVVVTGSRLGVTEQSSTSPIKIISRDEIEDLAVTSIGDFLQDLPQNIGGLNAQNNNGGDGSTQISLRGLGAARTLILLNGRRHVPYSTGARVDMNAIAPNTIERIDVLLDGASAVYGSDAIGGVINVITRKDFDGLTLSGTTGRASEGGGTTTDLNITYGASSDRGNVSVSIGSYEMSHVMAGDRAWAPSDLNYDWDAKTYTSFGSSATPEGTIIDRSGAAGNAAWDAARANGVVLWGPGGNNPSSTWSAFGYGGNSDTGEGSYYNYQPENYIYTPQRRYNAFLTAEYELVENVTAYAEMSYINRKSIQKLAPTPLFIISEGLTVAADQAYNPFGRDFIDVRRRMVEAGNRNFLQDIDTFRFVGGYTIDIGSWTMDAYYNYGLSDGTDTNEGRFVRSRVEQALSADCTGTCVPLNLFGGPGSITQDQIDYISYIGTAATSYEQKTTAFTLKNEELFELPAGYAGMLVGFESREEGGKFINDPLTEMGDTTGNKGENTEGDYTITEYFLELNVPVIDGMDFNLAVRQSDYSLFGETTNAKYGLRYDVIEGVFAVRGTISEAFNAPSVGNLYGGQSDSFPAVSDPCSTIAGAYLTNTTVKANCDADGIGGTADPNSQLRARVGGSVDVLPETAESMTLGFVWTPLDDFSINMDYFSYELEDTIGTVGAGYILGACYYSSSANRSRCDKVERDNNNLIKNIYATTTNIGQVENSGVDVQVDYGFDTGFGRFDLAFDYTKLLSYDLISPTSDGQGTTTTDCIDIYDCGPVIDGKWILDAFWTLDQYSARLRLNGYPSFEECDGACSSETSIRRDIEMVTYVTAAGSYDFQQGTTVNLSISNLLNEEPPRIFNAFYSAADESYDFMGRYMSLTVTHEF